MAYTFPLPLEQFFDGLPIESGTPDLGEAYEMSETGGGEILTAAIGNRLWTLDVAIATRSYAEGQAIMAKLNLLRYPGRSLLCRPSPVIGPASDPKGIALASFAPTIGSIASNNRDVQINGLPVGLTLKTGDYVSFTYGANPTRYALHQIVQDAAVNSDGRVIVEVTPFIQPGAAIGQPITLVRPRFKAIIRPGSVKAGKVGSQRVEGIGFSLIQTFQ